MGRRGPPPKPTPLKLLHGAKPHRINSAEPQMPDGPVRKPPWLSPSAAAEWDEVAPHLSSAKVLTVADATVLGFYCETVAVAKRLSELAANSPPVVTGREKTIVKNPIFAQRRDAVDQALRLAREFGLTPSARSGIKVEVSFADPASRLLTGNG